MIDRQPRHGVVQNREFFTGFNLKKWGQGWNSDQAIFYNQ
jgi:hypothetical protein